MREQPSKLFCAFCGSDIPRASSGSRPLPGSGALPGWARFCSNCGKPAPVAESQAAEGATAVEPSPKTNATPGVVEQKPGEGSGRSEPSAPKTPLTATAVADPSGSRPATCACGRQLAEEDKFCARCGSPAGQDSEGLWLSCTSEGMQPCAVQVTGDEFVVGKGDDCDLAITADQYVSRRHARLRVDDGLVFLEDLGSSNGTLLRIRRPVVVEPGDEILVGTTVLRVDRRGRQSKP